MQRIIIGLSVLMATLMSSCKEEKSHKEMIVGDWSVQWTMDPNAYPDLKDTKTFVMNGYMSFQKDSSLRIEAFGYPGCIFSADTMKHELMWSLANDSTLNFISDGDKYGLPYKIKMLKTERMELQLMDDIQLQLTKI